MEYRRLGKSGLQVSALSLGSWLTFGKQIENSIADELMTIAYDNGVNFFDNAEIYARGRSETVMGEILKKKGWDRDSYIVSSKVFFGYLGKDAKPTQKGLHRKHVVEACEQALKRLQLDYLDLYFMKYIRLCSHSLFRWLNRFIGVEGNSLTNKLLNAMKTLSIPRWRRISLRMSLQVLLIVGFIGACIIAAVS
jgi:aryl-alcohol dehydrogenase-like predicted oxidoreductase